MQVPYLRDVASCYPNASLSDARSAPASAVMARPPTVHPDASPVPYFPHLLHASTPPTLTPAGCQTFQITKPTATGSFRLSLGPFTFEGQELGQEFAWGGAIIRNACVVLTWAHVLDCEPQHLFNQLLDAVHAASTSMGPPAARETRTTVLIRALIHDVAASPQHGHACDSLTFLYFPPQELHGKVVVLIHYEGSDLAVDVVYGPEAADTDSAVFCLQRRGNPGHMQPLLAPTATTATTLSALLQWLTDAAIPTRHLRAQGWRAFLNDDCHGPAALWAEHAHCDFCHLPRFPLPQPAL